MQLVVLVGDAGSGEYVVKVLDLFLLGGGRVEGLG